MQHLWYFAKSVLGVIFRHPITEINTKPIVADSILEGLRSIDLKLLRLDSRLYWHLDKSLSAEIIPPWLQRQNILRC
ncbi:hypothetical protein IQ238_29525 [Pleurocapsales cyanobacterium LEGE 06147]|nr:hypothetical protein [Pleurocapsales cyanobacterium LEGE 06147]